jgi:FkbM family methyltransferase
MKTIMSRTGEKLGITLFDNGGNARELESMEEYYFLVNLWGNARRCLKYIIAKSLVRMDAVSLFVLSKFLMKKMAGAEITTERDQLFERLSGIHHFELLFRGRRIQFSQNPGFIFNTIHQVFTENQYNVSEKNVMGKIVVDAGSQLGDFSILCACYGAKKVYAFEPIEKDFKILQQNIKLNGLEDIIIPFQNAVGSENGKVNIGSATSPVDVDCIALDTFLDGERIDFLKMDIEGDEEKALIGAKETIKKFKPILSFAAYHYNGKYKTRLQEVVHSIRPDYAIKLNSFYEEDFYCE